MTALDCRPCEAIRRRDALAQWIASLRQWDYFGGLTFDQRRERGERQLRAQHDDSTHDVRSFDAQRNRWVWVGQTDVVVPRKADVRRRGLARSPRLADVPNPPRLDGQPISGDVARSRLCQWLKGAEHTLGRRLVAVVALEYQRNGWPHFHPLVSIQGEQRGDELAMLGQLWYERNGYGRLERPRRLGDVAAYCAKYIVKDFERGDLVLWPTKGPLAMLG